MDASRSIAILSFGQVARLCLYRDRIECRPDERRLLGFVQILHDSSPDSDDTFLPVQAEKVPQQEVNPPAAAVHKEHDLYLSVQSYHTLFTMSSNCTACTVASTMSVP